MTHSVTTLTARGLRASLGIVVNIWPEEVRHVAAALEMTGISLIRLAVNDERDVECLRALKALVPGLRVNVLVTAYSFHPGDMGKPAEFPRQNSATSACWKAWRARTK